MKIVKVTYQLDEAGRRASLRAGGDGRVHQVLLVEATPELLGAVAVDEDGSASYDLSSWRHEGVAGVYCTNRSYSDVVRDPVAEVMREEKRRAGLLALEASKVVRQHVAIIPEGFHRSGSAKAVGWFNFSKVGNTLRGRLLGSYERPDSHRIKGSGATSSFSFRWS
jgi:hypothetical protein